MPFFSDVHEKITAFAHILSKKRPFSKKTFFSCPYFVKKRAFAQKQNSLMTFFQICHENSLLSCPYLLKKNIKSVKITLFWAKKNNRMPFFSDFSQKNNCSNAHILSKNRPFSEKNLLLWPYYVKNSSTVVFVLNTPLLNTPPG